MKKKLNPDELIIAKKQISFQNKEIDEHATEMVISPFSDSIEPNKDENYIGHLAAIVEFSDDAIISKSLDGIVKSWNKGGEKMFGYTAKEIVGKHISLIIPAEYINEEKEILKRIRNNEIIDHYETVRSKKGGEQINVSITESPLKDREGNIIGVSKIARDITFRKNTEAELKYANKEFIYQNYEKEKRAAELDIANKELAFQNYEKEQRAAELIIANKELTFQNDEKEKRALELVIANKELAFQNQEKEQRAAELFTANKELNKAKLHIVELNIGLERKIVERTAQLEAANKELESFSYSVSHDLRSPLRAINGFTQVLAEDYGDKFDEEGKSILEEIISNSDKMGELIDNLLEFAHIGKQNICMMPVNMHKMLDSVIHELKQQQPDRKFNIRVKPLENINGDMNLLRQVFINLVSNAFKYTGKIKEAVVEIGSYKDSTQCTFYVKDNGAGFDMLYYDKLFGVFQRLHSNNEFEGTGVGLAIIQRIVSKHGGKVWAEAKVDEGACFYVSLPNA